jgi:iron complex outermembrane recepter protein
MVATMGAVEPARPFAFIAATPPVSLPVLRILLAAFLLAPLTAHGQRADTLIVDLELEHITVVRTAETAATVPFAVAFETRAPVEGATEPGASLESVLRSLPGLWVADRENFALGERLSVRGMGARAGFGVRGVQVVLDGIPLTLPDGQTALSIVDPSLIRRVELVRGPASAFWGNGSGGVLFLGTIPVGHAPTRARVVGGSHGLLRTDVDAFGRGAMHQAGLAVSHVRRDGYRTYSAFEVTRARGFVVYDWMPGVEVTATGALEWAPEQQHPGALTAEEMATDPRQAQANFVSQSAGKSSSQGQLGVQVRAATGRGTVRGSVYGMARSMENPLPFAYIDLGRLVGGARLTLEGGDYPFRWALGADAGMQRDDRQNWANVGGERGTLTLDQFEMVATTAGFGQASFSHGALTLSTALRYDRTRFSADNRLATSESDRSLGAWSTTLGASYQIGPALVFASASTSFETPTTTELVNRPDGGGGFNPELDPQRTRGAEVGARGAPYPTVFYDVALYRLAVRDQITPFEGEDGRTYYRNVEAARHDGTELLLEWQPTSAVRLGATYTWSRLVFTEESGVLAGNRVPGVPEHRFVARSRYLHRGLFSSLSLVAAGPTWADDANTARADGFTVLDLRAGHAGLPLGRVRLLPFVQIENVFDARYAGSVALNARAGRFYEPAAGRSFQVGLSVEL